MNMGNMLGSFLNPGMGFSSSTRMGSMLNQAGRLVGGNQNLAIGGIGALAGALMGSGRGLGGALRGGIGGGAVAMLGMMAYQAIRNSGSYQGQAAPPAYRDPQTEEERAAHERHAELILKAMINAAKADGHVDETEMSGILGKVQEDGGAKEELDFLRAELAKPMDTGDLVAAAKGNPHLAAEIYAASLLAVVVDTPAEKDYLAQLAADLELGPEVTEHLHGSAGM